MSNDHGHNEKKQPYWIRWEALMGPWDRAGWEATPVDWL